MTKLIIIVKFQHKETEAKDDSKLIQRKMEEIKNAEKQFKIVEKEFNFLEKKEQKVKNKEYHRELHAQMKESVGLIEQLVKDNDNLRK